MNTLHTLHTAALQTRLPAIENPIGGMTPSFSFGGPFDTWWKSVFAAGWGLSIIIALAFLLAAVLRLRSSQNNPMQHQQGKESLMHSVVALGILVAFGVITSAVFYVAG